MKKMDVKTLTKKLVEIPSYVDGEINEAKIGEFVFEYLKQFKWLNVKKQFVRNGRFNVIAYDNSPTKTIFCGHLDTVQIRSGWKSAPLSMFEMGQRLYGLGASDMKANIAAMLSALNEFKQTKGIMFFFYVDEEYDFLGMKKFIKAYKNKINPSLIVSGDGSNMQICNGCRGLIEITFVVKGKSGHAGRPEKGKNAIEIAVSAVAQIRDVFDLKFLDKTLGKSTANLAFLQGGLDLRERKQTLLKIGREGNNIADIAEFVLDIRPSDPKLDAKMVIGLISEIVANQGGWVESAIVRHDLGAWITPRYELATVEEILSKKTVADFSDLGSFGYIDIQMLWKAFKQVACFTIGAGDNGTAHTPNEWVSISKLYKLNKFFIELIHQFGKGGV